MSFATDFRTIVRVDETPTSVTRVLECGHSNKVARNQLNSIARADPQRMLGRQAPCPACAAATPTPTQKRKR